MNDVGMRAKFDQVAFLPDCLYSILSITPGKIFMGSQYHPWLVDHQLLGLFHKELLSSRDRYGIRMEILAEGGCLDRGGIGGIGGIGFNW